MYEKREGAERLDIAFRADLDHVDAVCEEARRFLDRSGLSAAAFDVVLVLREALSNAVIHGSKAGGQVRMSLGLTGDEVLIEVRDEGPGWDWRAQDFEVPPPESTSGRGLSIMKSYADELTFNEQGNAVCLRKRVRRKGADMSAGENAGSEAVVVLEKGVVATSVGVLKERFKSLVEQGTRRIVLDCAAMEVIDSMGIGLLVATHNSLAKAGGNLTLINTSEAVYNLLRTMRLDKHFTVKPA